MKFSLCKDTVKQDLGGNALTMRVSTTNIIWHDVGRKEWSLDTYELESENINFDFERVNTIQSTLMRCPNQMQVLRISGCKFCSVPFKHITSDLLTQNTSWILYVVNASK